MSKADVIEVEGTVVEKLPNAFFKEMCIRDRMIKLREEHVFLDQ